MDAFVGVLIGSVEPVVGRSAVEATRRAKTAIGLPCLMALLLAVRW